MLDALPFDIKSKILRHLYAAAISTVPLLQREADNEVFLTDICGRLQPYNCPAKTFVYQRGAFTTRHLLSAAESLLLSFVGKACCRRKACYSGFPPRRMYGVSAV